MCWRASGRPSDGAAGGSTGSAAPDRTVDCDVDEACGIDDPGRAVAADVEVAGGAEGGDEAIALDCAEQRRQAVADERRLLESLRTGEVAHAVAQPHLDRERGARHRLPGSVDGGCIRRTIADTRARALGDTHLSRAAWRRVRRRNIRRR